MKRIISYLKQVWENKSIIFEGIRNLLFAKGKIRIIAKKRRKVCSVCPYSSQNTKSSYKLPFKHCTICGCSLAIKPFAMEAECPKKFWFSRKL